MGLWDLFQKYALNHEERAVLEMLVKTGKWSKSHAEAMSEDELKDALRDQLDFFHNEEEKEDA